MVPRPVTDTEIVTDAQLRTEVGCTILISEEIWRGNLFCSRKGGHWIYPVETNWIKVIRKMNRLIRPGRKIKTKLEGCLTFFKLYEWRERGHRVLMTRIKNSIISELSYTVLPSVNSWAWWGQAKQQWGQTNSNTRVWSRKGFIAEPCKETLAHASPSNPELSEGFQESVFSRQGEGVVWLVVGNFLVWESFVSIVIHRGQTTIFL